MKIRRLQQLVLVTPFVGVWIEIRSYEAGEEQETVTPFVGVWIEILET